MPREAGLDDFLHDLVDGRDFRHRDHVRIAYELLRRHDFLDAAGIYRARLKGIAARAGSPDAYHETMTLAFLALIAERLSTRACSGFDDFAAQNPDLLDRSVLRIWYESEQLDSELARRTFVLPLPAKKRSVA